ncbi:hypothetical protein V6N11_081693 [Hibiscus sabdariffa]|uniref:Cytochrome P450 n=1 Tax=Hibiscus sabdariffa TaxID=183260 RepID=A0ABR2Q6W7_9ROSI
MVSLCDSPLLFFSLFCPKRHSGVALFPGYFIPKGWKVLVWHSAVHMDPEVYPDPKQFLPSRRDDPKLKAGGFLAFGEGSGTCPGADLAKLEISIFLHYFLLNYKFEQFNPGGPVNYLPSPEPADDCLAKIIKLN